MTILRFGLCLVAIFLVATTLVPAAHAQSDLDSLIATDKRAQEFERQNRMTEAAREWEKALALSIQILGPEHPTTGDLLHTLGVQYAKLGRYTQSIPLVRGACVPKPSWQTMRLAPRRRIQQCTTPRCIT
jgi:hypothetical protein